MRDCALTQWVCNHRYRVSSPHRAPGLPGLLVLRSALVPALPVLFIWKRWQYWLAAGINLQKHQWKLL